MPTRSAFLAAVVALVVAGPAVAQREPVEIEDVKIGLPPGRFVGEKDASQRAAHVVKRNTWAPVYLRLAMKKEYDGGALLKIDAADADDLKTTMIVPLAKTLSGWTPGAKVEAYELGYVPYVRSGDRSGEVMFTVISDPNDGSRPKEISPPFKVRYAQFRDANTYVVMSLGSKLPGFDLPQDDRKQSTTGGTRSGLRGGRVETAAVTNVREMPDQWFGYAAADLVVLTTGGGTAPEFLDELFDREKSGPFKERRNALLEWVRRGGRLVISTGSRTTALAQHELFRDLLPAPVRLSAPTKEVAELRLNWKVAGNVHDQPLRGRTAQFPVAQVNPAGAARPPRVLLTHTDNPGFAAARADDIPLVVQAPYGLGRVTFVAFDLDQSPFADFPKRAEFWDWLVREAGSPRSALASKDQNANNVNYGYTSTDQAEDEFLTNLRQHVDTFDGVPVVSFGWVALFIVLYTLLIGPVEYLFLKLVLKRLELTWITFPLIVLTVSAAAYFTAYAIKGNDLKVNKVDVVDVDLAGGRVYGRAYFTIFSPRIDSYTIGVEPREGWSVTRPNEPTPPTLVDWMGGSRGGSSSAIVSRGYSYQMDRDASVGLVRVPIQVWSTKAFTASWCGFTDPATKPIEADLYHPPGKPEALTGSFVNNLPVKALQDPVLFYAGKAYKLPTLTPGQRVDVPAVGLTPDDRWFERAAYLPASVSSNTGYNKYGQQQQALTTTDVSLWGALFHEKALGSDVRALQNASIRELDQSWRLSEDNKDEAILVARVERTTGPAEDAFKDPTGSSPTRLWLKGLPGPGAVRQPVPGTLRQETYVRVYIPIRPAGKK